MSSTGYIIADQSIMDAALNTFKKNNIRDIIAYAEKYSEYSYTIDAKKEGTLIALAVVRGYIDIVKLLLKCKNIKLDKIIWNKDGSNQKDFGSWFKKYADNFLSEEEINEILLLC